MNSRAPFYTAIAILGTAVVLALVIVLTGSGTFSRFGRTQLLETEPAVEQPVPSSEVTEEPVEQTSKPTLEGVGNTPVDVEKTTTGTRARWAAVTMPTTLAEIGQEVDPKSPALEPTVTRVSVPNLHKLDPAITAVEIRRDADISADPKRWFDMRTEVRALEESCELSPEMLFSMSTGTGEVTMHISGDKLTALLADLQKGERDEQCSSPEVAGFQGPPPGGLGWWRQPACEEQDNAYLISSGASEQMLLDLIFAVLSWEQTCRNLGDPRQVAACLAAVGRIQGYIDVANHKALQVSLLMLEADDHLHDALRLADQKNLGGLLVQGNLNVSDLVMLGGLALQTENLATVATTQATEVLAALQAARQTAAGVPALVEARLTLERAVSIHIGWQQSVSRLTTCIRDNVQWIVNAAAIRLGIRFPFPGGGGGGARGPGAELAKTPNLFTDFLGRLRAPLAQAQGGDPRGFLAEGLFTPEALAFQFRNPIVIDLDSGRYPSQYVQGTRSDGGGNVSRSISVGYEFPMGTPLPEDIWGLEPLTLVPMRLAVAGMPIYQVSNYSSGPGYIPQVRVRGGGIVFDGLMMNLVHEDTDENGRPIFPYRIICYAGEDHYYCGLSMSTWGSPEDIAAGKQFSAYWHILTTGGIVDPRTGEVVEDHSGFFINLRKRAERPSDPCWVWDTGRRYYVWDEVRCPRTPTPLPSLPP